MHRKICIILLSFLIIGTACRKAVEYDAKVNFVFTFTYPNESPLDSLRLNTNYTIPSGEEVNINEIQYFISDIALINDKNEKETLHELDFSHYVDISLPSTRDWTTRMPIPSGVYTGIEFVFGFRPEHNKNNQFVNPPENLMFWPEILGGGYHYMKINGKWKNPDSAQMQNFGMHAGIGQTWENGLPTAYYQNYFVVKKDFFMPLPYGTIAKLRIDMNVQEWFQNPNTWDFTIYGGAIMQNQTAQNALKENGSTVFSVTPIE